MTYVDIVFDRIPSGPDSATFVEVEDATGASINLGEWVVRDDDYAVLRVPVTSTVDLTLVGVAPLGWDLNRDVVREVWNEFVKPDQDAGNLQSGEMRVLMACLRTLYVSLPATEQEPVPLDQPKQILTAEETNRFAQFLYEAISDAPGLSLTMNMTAKGELVDAITNALGRVK